MKRVRAGYINRIHVNPSISDYYHEIDGYNTSGDRDDYYNDHIHKRNYEYGSFTFINKRDFILNKKDYFRL